MIVKKKWVIYIVLFLFAFLHGYEPVVKAFYQSFFSNVFLTDRNDWVAVGGFKLNGEYPSNKSELSNVQNYLSIKPTKWASWSGNDGNTGKLISKPFTPPKEFGIFAVGYPNRPGNQLYLEKVSSGEKLAITRENPKENWVESKVTLPDTWFGDEVRIVAIDESTDMFGWLGISTPFYIADSVKWIPLLDFRVRLNIFWYILYFIFMAWLLDLIQFKSNPQKNEFVGSKKR
jgi:hypothetical protein